MNLHQPSGADMIAAERQRQVEHEGWMPEHDDEYRGRELVKAATVYANHAGSDWSDVDFSPLGWPWDDKWWKPSGDAVRDLVKAGALIAAEIDRLQRVPKPHHPDPPFSRAY